MDGLRITLGEPSDSELAALVAVLARCGPPPAGPRPRTAWADPGWHLGRASRVRPGVWRLSGLPA